VTINPGWIDRVGASVGAASACGLSLLCVTQDEIAGPTQRSGQMSKRRDSRGMHWLNVEPYEGTSCIVSWTKLTFGDMEWKE
jgi:hypothetical protein